MASESPQIERTPPQSGAGDKSGNPAAETTKRKAEQTNGTQMRTKRNRYISIAWYDYGLIGIDALYPRISCFFPFLFVFHTEGSVKATIRFHSARPEICHSRLTGNAFF